MPQSHVQNFIHLIFSTKDRALLITNEIRDELMAYLIGVLKNQDCIPIKTNAVSDHVHVLFSLSKNKALSKIVGEMKEDSSKWIKTKGAPFQNLYWHNGYGAFSVSKSNVAAVESYIVNQEEHHRKISFQDELRRFLEKHGIPYDERYLWD